MSSIDERIVSMKFNNSQFEAGIKTTLDSLDGLKKGLNFDAAIKNLGSLDQAGKKVGFKFDNAQFEANVKTSIGSVENLKKNLKFDNAVKSLSDLDNAGKKVNLKLDAAAFQAGVKGVIDSAGNLKANLNFSSVQQGIGNLANSAKNFSMQNVITGIGSAVRSVGELDFAGKSFSLEPMAAGIDRIAQKFDGMSVVGIAALGTLGVKAAQVGLKMAQSLFVDPAKSGLQEYETQINAIQTIMANTSAKGTTLTQVNSALNELNTYSDKTIYNFSEMARNIGTFTAAGVDLKTSTSAIKGIANIAAMSGSTSEQASTAMYQLSQAMASGTVKLMDWNSVVNAGMGGATFQEALKQTARNQGVAIDDIIKKNGSFRDSLQEGWLTSGVLTETLSKFTGDLNAKQLKAMGYNQDQIKGIMKMAKTASDAATKIKTFSQLVGTIQETSGSGWARTWQIVAGDFEEAKVMFTNVGNVIGALQQKSANARNKMLGDWKKLGGRKVMIEAVTDAFKLLMGVFTPIQKAFREVFPPTTGKQLYAMTVAVRNFIKALLPGKEATSIIYNSFKLLFSILKIGVEIIGGVIKVIGALIGAIFFGGQQVNGAGKAIGDFIGKIANAIKNSDAIPKFFDIVANGATLLGKGLGIAIKFLVIFATVAATAVSAFVNGGFDVAMTRVRMRLESFGRLGQMLVDTWDNVKKSAADLWQKLAPLRDAFKQMMDEIGKNVSDALKDVSFNDALDLVNTGLLGGLVLLFRNFFKKGLGLGGDVKDGILKQLGDAIKPIKGIMEGLTGTLEAMQKNLQADTLMKIAIAIGVLTASVVVLSLIDSAKLTKALVAIAIMFKLLGVAMGSLDKLTAGKGFIKMPFIAGSMILLGIAILILAGAVKKMSDLSWTELIKGLIGVNALLLGTAKAAQMMGKNPANLIATGVGMIAIAIAIKILASAVKDFSSISWGSMIKGLVGVGLVLGALTLFNKFNSASTGSVASGISLILLGTALKIMASAVGDFAAMDIGNLIQGIGAMATIFVIVATFVKSTGNATNLITAAIAMGILAVAMKMMASAVGDFGAMDMGKMTQGLMGMAGAMLAIAIAMRIMPPNILVSAIGLIAVGAALKIVASALKDMGGMSWDEIGKGLVVLGGSMLILAIGLNLMTGTIAGSAALLVAAVAMGVLAKVLQVIGAMPIDQILIGLGAMAAVFILFGVAGLVLAPVVPVILALGIAVGLFGLGLMAVGLGTLAFVTGLIALAAVGAVVGPVLVALVTSILKLIPIAMQQLGLGIVAFAKVIGDAAPVFLQAFVSLLKTLLTSISIVAPILINTLWVLIVQLVGLIVRAVPLFINAGMKIIIGVLKGIGDNIGKLIDEGAKLIVNFINGIARNIGKIIDSGANLIVKFVQGLGAAVRTHSREMSNAGLDLAGAIIDGMVNGVTDGIGRVAAAAQNIAQSALDTVKGWLGIHSPSREFYKIGDYSTQGLANGLTATSGVVSKAAEGVGATAMDSMKQSLIGLWDTLDADIEMTPSIRPVLDLSAIKKDSGLINGMLGQPKLSLDTTYSKATTLAKATRGVQDQTANTTIDTNAQKATGISLVQNNYSPKALSSAEIYRNTKNQLSVAKGALTP